MKKLSCILASICSFSLISGNLSQATRTSEPLLGSSTYLKRRPKIQKYKLRKPKSSRIKHQRICSDHRENVELTYNPTHLDEDKNELKNKNINNTYFEKVFSYLKEHPEKLKKLLSGGHYPLVVEELPLLLRINGLD